MNIIKKILILFISFFSYQLMGMEILEQPAMPFQNVLALVLPYCNKKDIVPVLLTDASCKNILVSEAGLFYAAERHDKKLFLQLLKQQNKREQKKCWNFLLHMDYKQVILSSESSESDEEESEHLLLYDIENDIEKIMCAYRHEIQDAYCIEDIKYSLRNYDGQNKNKDTITQYAHVKMLSPNPANRTTFSSSPLGFAIDCKNKYSVQLLLKTNGNAITYLNWTTKDCDVIRNTSRDIIILLCNYNSLTDFVLSQIMIWAMKNDDTTIVQKAIEKGFDVNVFHAGIKIPLLYALSYEKIEVARYLLGLDNINVNCIDTVRKKTPLHLAIDLINKKDDSIEIVKLLLEKKADMLAQDSLGNTPLHWAILSDSNNSALYAQIIQLLKKQAPEDIYLIKNNNGETIADLEKKLNEAQKKQQLKKENSEKEIKIVDQKITEYSYKTFLKILCILTIVSVIGWYYYH